MIPRTFTAYQAIAAGAKTLRELCDSLGWNAREAESALRLLRQSKQVRLATRRGTRRFVYEVAR